MAVEVLEEAKRVRKGRHDGGFDIAGEGIGKRDRDQGAWGQRVRAHQDHAKGLRHQWDAKGDDAGFSDDARDPQVCDQRAEEEEGEKSEFHARPVVPGGQVETAAEEAVDGFPVIHQNTGTTQTVQGMAAPRGSPS